MLVVDVCLITCRRCHITHMRTPITGSLDILFFSIHVLCLAAPQLQNQYQFIEYGRLASKLITITIRYHHN